MSKKFLALLLMAVMMFTCASAETSYNAGTYTASAPGMGGDVVVSVAFSADKIESVTVNSQNETDGLGTIPLESMPSQIVEAQSLAIDGVAGATVSSTALIEAVKDCVTQAGGDVEALLVPQEKETVQAEDIQADIVVVGGGAAGLTAAIRAKYAGVENVILLEAMATCGGSTSLSGGVMTYAAEEGNPEGDMTADEMYDYILSFDGSPDPDMIRMYVDNSPAEFAWFTSLEGADMSVRYHNTPENVLSFQPTNSGFGVTSVLVNEAEKNGVDIRVNHKVTDLIQDESGKIVGVICTNDKGETQNVYSGAVVLATGGFANNADLIARFAGEELKDYVVRKGAGGANGDGILMAERVGAALHFGSHWDTSGMNTVWIDIDAPQYGGYFFYPAQMRGILVNSEGNRFVREDYMLPRIYEYMVNEIKDGRYTFHVIETMEGFLAAGATEEQIQAVVDEGQIQKYDTIEELAEAIGVPADTLRATIEAYAAETEEDPFGKVSSFLGSFNADGPFYTAETKPQRSGTMGGIIINTKAEVLDTEGNPIPGLFAAGETANGNFFDNYYYICGNMVMHALVTGHAAGDSAAAYIK